MRYVYIFERKEVDEMTDLKKKLVISGLAVTMITTSAFFAMNRIHGEGAEATVVSENKGKYKAIASKKAMFTASGTVTGRTDSDTSNSTNITDLGTITDLMIDDQVTSIPASKFANLQNLTTLTFKGANAEGEAASKVTTIGMNAFKGSGITSVELPKKLTSIEAGAFADTAALTTVTFTHSTNLQHIKTGAFENSGLTSLDLSPMNASTAESLEVGAKAFKGNTKLANATLSTKMKTFEAEVFASTKLTTVEIGQYITTVTTNAFKGTPLATLTVNATNGNFKAEANVLYNSGKTKLFLYPEGKADSEFTIPTTVTHIGENAFAASPTLTKVITNEGLTNIGDYAFDGASSLTGIELKNTVTQIGQYAFRGTGLTSIVLPSTMVGINTNAFAGASSLAKLDLRKASALTTVQANAFKNTALNSMVIGKSTGALTMITAEAFNSSATSRQVSFLGDDNAAISGEDLTTLMEKYKALKTVANGSWSFDVKFPTPSAVANYEQMKLTGLVASAEYTIGTTDYTANEQGEVALLKTWGGTTISIVRKASEGQKASEAQSLVITAMHTVSVDGVESVKKVGASVTVNALVKPGYVFKTWAATGVDLDSATQKNTTFTMPAADVSLTSEYTQIVVTTSAEGLVYNGESDLVVTLTSPSANLAKLAVNDTALTKGTNYTVSENTTTTVITLKASYLNTLSNTTRFVTTFTEGGDIAFSVKVYGRVPSAVANYNEMKLTNLTPLAVYTIKNVDYIADAQGKVDLLKVWGGTTISIVRKASSEQTESYPQNLAIDAMYTVTIDGTESSVKKVGATVAVNAPVKVGYVFKTWLATGVTLENATQKNTTFTMPSMDVNLTREYTEIVVATPVADLVYNGKTDVVVTLTSPFVNFTKLVVNGTTLTKGRDYTVSGSDTTLLTLKVSYLNTVTDTVNFVVTFTEGGDKGFSVRLPESAPAAVANYNEMKVTGLEENAQYKINGKVMRADGQGKIVIERSWGGSTLEISKVGVGSKPDSKPQRLSIAAFYSVMVNGKEVSYKVAGATTTVTAENKEGYKFRDWTAKGVKLTDATQETITFTVPTNDVELGTNYTKIITTMAEDMVFNGTKGVTVSFAIPMNEFRGIEYNGKVLVKDKDYTVVSGSTIITFTKAFLDTVKADMNGIKAMFRNDTVEFSIRYVGQLPTTPPANPVPPVTDNAAPVAQKSGTNVAKSVTTSPKTGDSTNIFVVFTIMVCSAGIILFVKKRKKQI